MKRMIKTTLFCLAISTAVTAHAKIYQWKDANGVMQFTQTPPPKLEGEKMPEVKVKEEKKSVIKDEKICGILDAKKLEGEKLGLLYELHANMEHWENMVVRFSKEHDEAMQRQNEIDKRPHSGNSDVSSAIKSTKEDMQEFQCMVSWGKDKMVEMEPVHEQYLKDLERTKNEYAELKAQNASAKVHNKKLHELKKLKVYESALK